MFVNCLPFWLLCHRLIHNKPVGQTLQMDVPEWDPGTSICQHQSILSGSIFYLHHAPLYQSPFLSLFPSIILHDWLIDWLSVLALLYSAAWLEYRRSSLSLSLPAVLLHISANLSFILVRTAEKQIYNQTNIFSCLKWPHGRFIWILTKCTGYHWQYSKTDSSTEKQGMLVTYKVAAVNKSTCGECRLVCGERLHWAVRGGAARASRRPEEDLCLARLHAHTHTHKKKHNDEKLLYLMRLHWCIMSLTLHRH